MITDARIVKCPAAEYHARAEWSQSQFTTLPSSPEDFYGSYIAKEFVFKTTADMELGTNLHAVWLEKQELLVIPPSALTSNGQRRGKNWEGWKEDHPDNPGVLEKDTVKIRAMLHHGLDCPTVRSLMEAEGEVELSIVGVDQETGLPLRARLDKRAMAASGRYYIVDLKSTSIDVTNPLEVGKKIIAMQYDQQGAHYWIWPLLLGVSLSDLSTCFPRTRRRTYPVPTKCQIGRLIEAGGTIALLCLILRTGLLPAIGMAVGTAH